MLAKLDALQKNLDAAYAGYEFNTTAALLYEFFWGNYCDLYLETIKGDTSEATLATQDAVLSRFFVLLHPYMPHITEELWATMGYGKDGEFLMQTQFHEPVLAGVAAANRRSAGAGRGRLRVGGSGAEPEGRIQPRSIGMSVSS